MILPETIRSIIADRIIRIVAPAIIGVAIIAIAAILFFSGQQYNRIFTAFAAIIFALVAWLFAYRQKPLIGIRFILICFIMTSLVGIFINGGVKAPIYAANLSFITLVVVIYGLKGGIIYALSMFSIGAITIKMQTLGVLPPVAEPPALFLLIHYGYMMFLTICFVLVPVRLMLETLVDSQNQSNHLTQAVDEKQQAQENLQSILDKTPDIIYRLNKEGEITYISRAVSKYGYKPEELIGTSIAELVPPGERTLAEPKLSERRTGARGTRGFEAKLMNGPHLSRDPGKKAERPNWTTFHVYTDGLYSEGHVSPDSFLGTQGIAHDVSKLKDIEKRISFLASVVDQAAEDVIITDPRGIINYVNPKFEEITGYLQHEVIGKTTAILKSSKHNDFFFKDIWRTITSGHVWQGHIWNKTKSGKEILQDVTIKPILDSHKNVTGYVSVRRDITKQVEREQQTRQSQKMEAIGTLAGGIAHDFNNILSGILGYAELAKYDVEDSPKTLQKLDNIIDAGQRATALVSQILSFSRSQKTTPVPVSPKLIGREVLKLLRASLPANIEIVQSFNSEFHVFADPVNIHQVFMNLCTNAGHAMREEGGKLTVLIEDTFLSREDAENYIGLKEGKYIKISIEDTGQGIPEEIQKQIFDPFFTTKIRGEGTGMGLSVVHGIVKDLEGSIFLRSKVNKGTSFEVFLPAIDERAEIPTIADKKVLPGGSERILFVDDEEMQANLAKESLSRFGYKVTVFTNSLEAFKHFLGHADDYDLVITDMTMPVMTGDILTKEIHQIKPKIPVIMFTGFSEIMDAEKARVLNIKALVYKPVIREKLLKTVRKVLDEIDK
jgi:PAS domain S-box-containing protein